MIRVLFATAALAGAAVVPIAVAQDGAVERGRYVFHAAGCATCHTDTANQGEPLAGGRRIVTEFGVFYSPNITPDRETGIGGWTDDDFRRAFRLGKDPQGRHYYPVFPYTSYTLMTDGDIADLKAYLFSLPPVRRVNRPHEVRKPFDLRHLMAIWKILYWRPGPYEPDAGRDAQWNRGAYLVRALGHCGECHTPRRYLGALDHDRWLAGTAAGPAGDAVPNITPDPETGIGKWSRGDLETFLESGMFPDGDFAGAGMGDVIENTTSKLTKADLAAMIAYLRSVPPIRNAVAPPPAR